MLWTTSICCVCMCMLWTSFDMLWVICCGFMLWVTLTYVVENIFINVVHNMYPHNISLVLHIISYTTCCGYVVGDMLWTPTTYLCCGEHVHQCCPQHVYVLHNIWYVVKHICRFHYVPHNIHPQHIMFSTTYTHNICWNICCGCMLWITISICCVVHILWSAMTFVNTVLILHGAS